MAATGPESAATGTPGSATPSAEPAGAGTSAPDPADEHGADRPGDIPFDQAQAEHENPDLR